MNKFIENSKKYIRMMNLTDLALLKVCLITVGVLLGLSVPQKQRKKVAAASSIVFATTYIPLMTKYLGTVIKKERVQ